MAGTHERREALKAVFDQARGCVRCPQLAASRQTVVFGAGNADSDLMFVGEAPGANEDRLGLPFVGQAGKLLERLLNGIGLERGDVFIANVLKCRPPGNRDPHPVEIENCQDYLMRQVELIEPQIVCTLGNFATKLLRGDPAGITRLHGRAEIRTIGVRAVRLYPLFHPAAALYTPRMLQTLEEDFARIPSLLQLPVPDQPPPREPAPTPRQAGARAVSTGEVLPPGDAVPSGDAVPPGDVLPGGEAGPAGSDAPPAGSDLHPPSSLGGAPEPAAPGPGSGSEDQLGLF